MESKFFHLSFRGFLAGMAGVVLFITVPAAFAATITVDSLADNDGVNGNCTLREALDAANNNATQDNCAAGDASPIVDTINVPLIGTITLADPTVALYAGESVNIVGSGPGNLTIDATGNASSVFVFDSVGNDQTFNLSAVRLTGGNPGGVSGGGILLQSGDTLTVSDSVIEGNNQDGINSAGTLNLNNSFVNGNTDTSGGGILINAGTAHITGSTIDSNTATASDGGGISINGPLSAPVTIVDSTISNNTTVGSGGGIYVAVSDVSIDTSTISGNSADLDGGGVQINQSTGGSSITNSTISGNNAKGYGGGISHINPGSILDLVNVTITGNTSDSDSDTIGDGGGINSDSSVSRTSLLNTIISGNIDNSATAPDCSDSSLTPTLVSNDYNLISDLSACTVAGTTTHNITGVGANLGVLAANFGTTFTHALLAGSPAIDAGTSAGAPTVDQRGKVRPDGAAYDIGAYELQTAPVIAEVTPVTTPTTDTTPAYTFSTDEAGTITYGGDCSSATTAAVVGSNSITFNALAVGLHSNCTVTVTDAAGNASNLLNVTAFTISSTSSSGGGAGGCPGCTLLQYPNSGVTTPAPSSTQQVTTQQVTPTPAIEPFTDIQNHWAKQYIEELQQQCGITGYLDANGNPMHLFMPDQNISRAELITMIMKCKYGSLTTSLSPFQDVQAADWAAPYVEKAKELGVVQGYGDGTFRPNEPANRAEALKMILLSWFTEADVSAAAVSTKCSDVEASSWYGKYFFFALDKGIVSGYRSASGADLGVCGPGNDLTRAEGAKMIVLSK